MRINSLYIGPSADRTRSYPIALLLLLCLPSACQGSVDTPSPADPDPGSTLHGQIVVDPLNPAWLKYEGGGAHFLAGAGDPEDFLYRGELRKDGTRRGDQEAIIRKLRRSGANGIYFQAVRSHGGDGDRTHNPFVGHDAENDLNEAILDQWEGWFKALDDAGIAMYFFFYDDSSRIWNTGEHVSNEEQRFFEALVNRFEHHKHIVWIIAEEYQEALSKERVSRLAAVVRAEDDHNHVIGVHKLSGLDFSEFADDPNIEQFTIQYNKSAIEQLHRGILQAWSDANGRYNLNMSETRDHGTGKMARLRHWAIAMAGAYVMVYKMDIANSAESDLADLGRLRYFMESTNFNEMTPDDSLGFASTRYVLARPGHSYIAYSSDVSSGALLGLRLLRAGSYDLFWFNPETGDEYEDTVSVKAGKNTWRIPDGWAGEIVVYARISGAKRTAEN